MTTARDLLIVSMDMASDHPVEQGDLSLALAGAEVIDLLDAQAIRLEGDHIVPGHPSPLADRLLDEAASSLVREAPHTSVGDWLWRRGRDLSAAYLADLEAEGQVVRQRCRRWWFLRTTRMVLVDSPARRRAANRWTADEPVLCALAAAIGIQDGQTADSPGVVDDAVSTVLAAVEDAWGELAVERQRRARRREEAAENNRRRGY